MQSLHTHTQLPLGLRLLWGKTQQFPQKPSPRRDSGTNWTKTTKADTYHRGAVLSNIAWSQRSGTFWLITGDLTGTTMHRHRQLTVSASINNSIGIRHNKNECRLWSFAENATSHYCVKLDILLAAVNYKHEWKNKIDFGVFAECWRFCLIDFSSWVIQGMRARCK